MFRKSLIAIIVLLLAALTFAGGAQADGTPTPDPRNMSSTPEANDTHDHGDRIEANGAAVKIVSPAHNAALDRDSVTVRVETTNWPLGEGKHWHLYLNGEEQGMSQGNSLALQARDLQPGENIIEVVLSNDLHQELAATDKITVRYEAPAGAQTAADLSIPSGALIVLPGIVVAVAAILGLGFALTRKKA
jgi:hypothetical protein